jgi:hypothetical protein
MKSYRQQENGFMRHNQNRRSRGRNRKGPNPLTRSFESNGPDVKVRGTALHIADKYMSLARDAQSSGDIVAAENYLQHAEHYNRIVMAAQAQFQQERQSQFRDNQDEGDEDERQANGRGREPYEYNGEGARDDEGDGGGPDDRFGSTEEEQERSFQARQQQQPQPRSDDRERQRGPRPQRFDRRPDRFDRNDRSERFERNDRPERFERNDRPHRPDRFEAAEERELAVEAREAPQVPQPISEEAAQQPRRRRGRPPRVESAGEGTAEGEDATPDGAAALAAFPD